MDWFKFYGKDFLTDTKVRSLSPVHQLMFVYLLCHASDSDTGSVEYITEWHLAMSCGILPGHDLEEDVKGFFKTVEGLGMIKKTGINSIQVTNYSKRQNQQFTPAEKQKRYRAKLKKSNKRNQKEVTNVTLDKIRVDKIRVDKNREDIHIDSVFEEFWTDYPKKVGKGAAEKAWSKIKGVEKQKIIDALKTQRNQEQWRKDNGQYIPHPATWLNQRRWEDDVGVTATNDLAQLAKRFKTT